MGYYCKAQVDETHFVFDPSADSNWLMPVSRHRLKRLRGCLYPNTVSYDPHTRPSFRACNRSNLVYS